MAYLVKDEEYGTENLRMGSEVILQQNYNRCQLMKDYHQMKIKLWHVLSVKKIMDICFHRSRGAHIYKPTEKYFFNRMINRIEWAESCDGYGDADTEYYSACGYDDMILAQKEGAKGTALECWRALKELKDSLFDKKKYGNSDDELTAEYRQMLIYLRMNFGMFLNIRL